MKKPPLMDGEDYEGPGEENQDEDDDGVLQLLSYCIFDDFL